MSLGSHTDLDFFFLKADQQKTHTHKTVSRMLGRGGRVRRGVSQALTSSLGFQRELEKVTDEQRERKK